MNNVCVAMCNQYCVGGKTVKLPKIPDWEVHESLSTVLRFSFVWEGGGCFV